MNKKSRRAISRVLSVSEDAYLSFIQSLCHHKAQAFYPLPRADNPYTPTLNTSEAEVAVYMNLQQPRCTASVSPHRW